MKKHWIMALLLGSSVCWASPVRPKSLATLVEEADHVIIGTVTLVDMVDQNKAPVTNLAARVGFNSPNLIRLHVAVQTNGVLFTTAKETPSTLIIPLLGIGPYTLEQMKKIDENRTYIFLLKGPDFRAVYPAGFRRSLSNREEIEGLLKQKKAQGIAPVDTDRKPAAPPR